MKNVANVLIALMLGWATATSAAVIYSNGPIASNGFVSDTDFPLFVADDFSLVPGANVITGVQWTGLYAFSNTPQPDIFTIQFFADSGGAPVLTPFLSLAIGNPGRTDTGINVTSGGFDLFAYSVTVAPIALTPNTVFWLSIFNDTSADTNDNWFWGMQMHWQQFFTYQCSRCVVATDCGQPARFPAPVRQPSPSPPLSRSSPLA